jgi:hypothetical protein
MLQTSSMYRKENKYIEHDSEKAEEKWLLGDQRENIIKNVS